MRQTSIQIGFVLVLFAPFLSGCIGWIGRPVDAESQTRNLRIETIQATEPSADGKPRSCISILRLVKLRFLPWLRQLVKPNNRRSTLWRCRPYEKQ